VRRRTNFTTRKEYVLKQQNKRRTTAALLAATIAGAFGAGIVPSLAAEQGDAFDGACARGSHAHMRHANRLSRHHEAGRRGGGAQLTYYHSGGKLRLVNTDRKGGLKGVASVYHDPTTASGEQMTPNAMTAAHKSLPMGSIVTVHNKLNGRSVRVRINDRGPYVTGRVIDLSPGAARVIGMYGLAPVWLTAQAQSFHP
jgi:rare lipoprotein A